MKNIAQKSSASNTEDFFYDTLTKDYIHGMSFNIAYTEDDRLVVFNSSSLGEGIINTIETSTLAQLQDYEIILFDELLNQLNQQPTKKDIYINLYPLKSIILTDENIKQVTMRMSRYIDSIKEIIEKYPDLSIYLHCINRNLVNMLKQKIQKAKIGFVVYGDELTFIDVDYYVILMNTFNDTIIDELLKNQKEVILYIASDYYINYVYEHYLGEKSTPYLQQTFQKLGLISNYPEVIHKVFNTN